MTNINTIIEEEKKEFREKHPMKANETEFGITVYNFAMPQNLIDYITSAMQRAYKYGVQNTRADWLRSEIEKLKGMKRKPLVLVTNEYKPHQSSTNGYNQALDSIITRYKEELKVLESK